VADNDQITAIALDSGGRPIVAGLWVNRGDSFAQALPDAPAPAQR
jgi:hypothetical protein